jgi:hypothetical protein
MASTSERSERSGVVTLLTDFGERETWVGVMKGVLHTHATHLRAVVDLTHDVPPQDVRAATFHLRHAWRWFPRGTVHVAVVDPGVGTSRAILAASNAGHVFLAPDNGLLDGVLGDGDPVHAVDVGAYPERSNTFHGRDVFAPAAARLVDGAELGDLGPALAPHTRVRLAPPLRRALVVRPLHEFEAHVEHVDRFGNLILDLDGSALGADPTLFEVVIGERRVPFTRAYGSARPGDLLALVDSYGAVEIAVCNGDAARALCLQRGDLALVRRRT